MHACMRYCLVRLYTQGASLCCCVFATNLPLRCVPCLHSEVPKRVVLWLIMVVLRAGVNFPMSRFLYPWLHRLRCAKIPMNTFHRAGTGLCNANPFRFERGWVVPIDGEFSRSRNESADRKSTQNRAVSGKLIPPARRPIEWLIQKRKKRTNRIVPTDPGMMSTNQPGSRAEGAVAK